jgi:predicted PurR-regulated permease PerM
MTGKSGVWRFFENNWEKMVLWAVLIGLFYLLKPFFLLIFGTFLITFITRGIVCRVESRWRINHRAITIIVFLLFLGLMGGVGAWVGPKVLIESNRLVADFTSYGHAAPEESLNQFLHGTLEKIAGPERAEQLVNSEKYVMLKAALKAETARAVETLTPRVLGIVVGAFKTGWQFLVSLFLAIIFSFILVMDWNRIASGMGALERSRIRSFYLGAAPHLKGFAAVLGRNFTVQAIIAACNTFLTTAGLFALHVPNIALLSTIVFLCGFIPILGTFISAIPILLFAVQCGGLLLVFKIILLIGIVHAFEAYVLNPRIAAGFFHVHPILILVLLLVSERFFGLWGMVVGVPVGYYLISVMTKPEEETA